MHLIGDIKFASRSFLRAPRFTIPAVLALSLGIGSTSAIFSVVRGVMLTPLPYANPDRVVVVWESNTRNNRNVIGAANFVEWRARHRSFTHLGMAGPARLNLMLAGQPEEVVGMVASSDVFPIFGVQPALGRPYNSAEDEEGNDRVIVVSHEFWRTRLGARIDAVGSTINANGIPRTVIGVMPEAFTMIGVKADFLIPYGWTLEQLRAARGRGNSYGVARLRDGVSLEQASADMKAIARQLEKEAPQRNTGWSITLVPVHEQLVDQIRPALRVLTAAVILVLLIACVNVANLLLARSTVRQRELALRTAVGARRGRLVRQMLVENMLLGAIGGIGGLTLAVAFHRGLLALVAERLPVPRLDQVQLDLPVVVLTMVLSVATGLIFGIVPAIVSSRQLGDAFRDGGRHGQNWQARRVLAVLVAAEVALSLVSLTGAGLLVRSFLRLSNIDPGFRAAGLFTARVQLPGVRYDEPVKTAGFHTVLVRRIAAIPGVRSAAGVTFLPLAGPGIGTSFYRMDRPAPDPGTAPTTDVIPITPNFFRTMGIPQVSGRDFTAADRNDSPAVAIVNQTLVQRHFPAENPIGKRLQVNAGQIDRGPYEIVGVVADIKVAALDRDLRPTVYVPHTQITVGVMTLVARTETPPLSIARAAASAVRAMDPELPVASVRTMDDVVSATIVRPRVIAVLLSAFAVMALLLAAVGVYGVMAYSVSQRTQEIGVRIALGASPRSVFRLILRQAIPVIGAGVIAGLVAAAAVARLLATLLYQTQPFDPVTFVATAMLLVSVAVVATYVPARRGMRIAPNDALRAE